MAKIFRKVRQKFLAESKIKRYLIYAVGEIILVVIGILVALQINSVNLSHKRSKLEKVLLKQVRFEILEIYADVWRDAGNLELGNQGHYTISEYMASDKPYADSLCFDFYWLQVDEYVYPTNAAYSRLKEVGLDIIKNDSIRIDLQSLYEGYFPRLSKINSSVPDISNVFDDYYLNSFRPNTDLSLAFNFHLPDDTVGSRMYSDVYYQFPRAEDRSVNQSTIGYVPLDFEGLKKDPKFHMLLEKTKRYRDNKIRHYSSVKSIIKKAIIAIEEELGDKGN